MLLGEGAALILYILLLELKRKLAGKFNDGRNGGKESAKGKGIQERGNLLKEGKGKGEGGLRKAREFRKEALQG